MKETNSFLMMNIYPFLSYAENPKDIPMDYALFRPGALAVVDKGLTHTNLFDAMVDTVISAMGRVGYKDMQIVITETGWPNGGST